MIARREVAAAGTVEIRGGPPHVVASTTVQQRGVTIATALAATTTFHFRLLVSALIVLVVVVHQQDVMLILEAPQAVPAPILLGLAQRSTSAAAIAIRSPSVGTPVQEVVVPL